MTLNWGHKLTLVFLAFVGLMAYLVSGSMHTNYDLVSKEYYKDELAYQQVIDGTARARQLSAPVGIQQEGNMLIIRLPEEMKQQSVTGTLWFYCAQDAGRDRRMPFTPNSSGVQEVDIQRFVRGSYTVKLSWETKGVQYYTEQPLTIQ